MPFVFNLTNVASLATGMMVLFVFPLVILPATICTFELSNANNTIGNNRTAAEVNITAADNIIAGGNITSAVINTSISNIHAANSNFHITINSTFAECYTEVFKNYLYHSVAIAASLGLTLVVICAIALVIILCRKQYEGSALRRVLRCIPNTIRDNNIVIFKKHGNIGSSDDLQQIILPVPHDEATTIEDHVINEEDSALVQINCTDSEIASPTEVPIPDTFEVSAVVESHLPRSPLLGFNAVDQQKRR